MKIKIIWLHLTLETLQKKQAAEE